MTKFVDGLKSLFTGGKSDSGSGVDMQAQLDEQNKQREQQSISLDKQNQDLQNQGARQDALVGAATKVPRGRRLLLAATGEAGLTNKLGG